MPRRIDGQEAPPSTVIDGLREALLRGCQEAFQQPGDEALVQQGLRVGTNGDYQTIDLTVQALNEPEALHNLLMVVFTEVMTPAVKVRGKPVHTRDERWFTTRIMPYRTLDNRIDGVVLTFVEITAWKSLEKELQEVRQALSAQRADQAGGA